MGAKPNHSPRQFFVECPKCGTYRISEHTARKFLTPRLRAKLDDRLRKNAVGARLKFKGGCPNCEPNATHEVELIALTPRRMH